jgi:hypothetical protein
MAHRKSKPSDPMTKYGRPIPYDREILIAICRRLIIGEDLQKICTERGMPIEPVFLGWVQDHKEAREIYHSADNVHSDRRLVKELKVFWFVSVSEWEEQVRANLERGWRADWIDRKYIPPDWSEVYPLIGGPPVGSTEMQAYNDLLNAFTQMLEPRDEMELIWTKEATDATWEAGREAREKNRLTSVAQLANALDHGRPLEAGFKYYRSRDVAQSCAIKRRDNALRQIVRWRKGLGASARRLPDHLLVKHLLAQHYGVEQFLADAEADASYGRPIAYDREILIAICRRLIIGDELRKICTERGMPIGPVFLGWVQDHKEAREIYRSADNFHSDRRLAKEQVYRCVSVSAWEERVRANLERGWRAADRKYIPPDWSKVYPLIGGPPVGSTAYNDLLNAFTQMLEPRDEMELIWTKEATDATWEAGREAREKNRLSSVAQLANALDHGRPLEAGFKYYRSRDVAQSCAIKRRDNALRQIVRWRKGLGASARRLPDHLLVKHLLAQRYGAEQFLADAEADASAGDALEAAAPLAPTGNAAEPAPLIAAAGDVAVVAAPAFTAAGEAAEPAPTLAPRGNAPEPAPLIATAGDVAVVAAPAFAAAGETAEPAPTLAPRGNAPEPAPLIAMGDVAVVAAPAFAAAGEAAEAPPPLAPTGELPQPHPHVPLRPRRAQAEPPLAAPAAATEDAPPVRAPSEAAEQHHHRSLSQPGCAQARLDGAFAVRFLAEPTKSVAVNANRRL